MCGIVLLLDPGSFKDPTDALARSINSIAHRGLPGRAGTYLTKKIGMAHARLPIRGLSNLYDQPLVSDDSVFMYVGEIFNTDWPNDTQYAQSVLERHGPMGFAAYCDGFWNVVEHDPRSGRTQVVMDHLAIKPLYWSIKAGVIASEMRAILELVDHDLNEHYLSNVLKWGYDPTGQTPYKGIVKLEPGTTYTFVGDVLKEQHRYFSLSPEPFLVNDLRKELTRAITTRLISDIPVAVLCSGGLDSTIVGLVAAQASKDVTIFHIDNQEEEYFDLIPWPSHVKVQKLALEPVELDNALRATEDPVDLGSLLPQYQLGQALKKSGFHVVLTGDGADELFGGYRRAAEYDSQQSDIFSELIHYHLPRLDKTMMSGTVELRSPFLAPQIVELALATPYPKRTSKQLLKEAFSDILPSAILERNKKPLKTPAVITGGLAYRQSLVQRFREMQT